MSNTNITYISIDKLYPHKDNPRKEIGDVSELAESIKARGIMQNLTVIPRAEENGTYTVIIGHRRLAASKAAGIAEVPCVITEMTEREQLATMLLENMQRSDLTVYEQAQGFQMMIDLGESVNDIADKTGFSKATVRRRIKMAELDGDTLKEVSGRQISLADFDKLAEIEDISKRNEVLKEIGTANFNQRVNAAVKRQGIEKNLPAVKKKLADLKAKALTWSETYGGKYERITQVYFYAWDPTTELFDLKGNESEKLYYYLDDYGSVSLFKAKPKAPVVKKSDEEIAKAKMISDRNKLAESLTAEAKQLRRDFIKGITMSYRNRERIMDGAAKVLITATNNYMYNVNNVSVLELIGVDAAKLGYEERKAMFNKLYCEKPERVLPAMIYLYFECSTSYNYCLISKQSPPQHYDNAWLNALYDWLCSLGYEMSDDERKLRDGTHEVFGKDETEGG